MFREYGQVSVEYLIVFGFVTMAIIAILGIALSYSGNLKDNIKFTQLNSYAEKIISASESVFYAGEPSKATIDCYLPEGVKEVQVVENSLFIAVETHTGTDKLSYSSKVPISGSLSGGGGVKKIEVAANETSITLTEL
ncbi:hypothetical protein A3K73_02730 [Candidatus Pacearchaeota archaeon RBG_13_36_9]|nr:MAG: hypothetical protein A3K73_02730 [Candidatus Pacearchaeota archaeon RBG_13_36_9]